MRINHFKCLTLIGLLLLVNTCKSKKDSEINFNVENAATGLINQKSWTVKSGIGVRADMLGIKDFTINLVDTLVDNLCDRDYRKIRRICISLTELTAGKFTIEELQLQDELNGISFFDPDIHENFLGQGDMATEGFVEIKEINEKERLIKGYVEATLDEENTVKGNFIVKWCPKI